MNGNLETCPQCLGAVTYMEGKETKGFEYKNCTLCKGKGEVHPQLASDFLFSMNENNFDDDYEINNGW